MNNNLSATCVRSVTKSSIERLPGTTVTPITPVTPKLWKYSNWYVITSRTLLFYIQIVVLKIVRREGLEVNHGL